MLRLACSNAQTHQSRQCLHTHSMDVDEDSDQHLDTHSPTGYFCMGIYFGLLGIFDKYQNFMCWVILLNLLSSSSYANPKGGTGGPDPPPPPSWKIKPSPGTITGCHHQAPSLGAIISPPAKHHLNGISLAGLWWPA